MKRQISLNVHGTQLFLEFDRLKHNPRFPNAIFVYLNDTLVFSYPRNSLRLHLLKKFDMNKVYCFVERCENV